MEIQTKLRIGVIGCGRISVMHFVPVKALEQSELVACCDVKKDRADEAAEKYGCKDYEMFVLWPEFFCKYHILSFLSYRTVE